MTKSLPPGFKHVGTAYAEAIDYMQKRRTGEIKSVATPWSRFDNSLMGGFEWNTINVIAARPAAGKTLMASIITRRSFELNPTEDIAVLDFQFEMLSRNSAMREFSSVLERSMKELNSVGKKLSDADMDAARKYIASIPKDRPIYTVERPQSVDNLKKAVDIFATCYPDKKLLITLDHTMLVKKSSDEKDMMETLYRLGDALTSMKREYNCLFIILSQLNRDIESTERIRPGTIGNYPLSKDVFQSDSILQHTDNLIALNRPAKYNIDKYGPNGYLITDKNIIAAHLLKARNGVEGMLWFYAEFEKMRFQELTETSKFYPIAIKSK